MTRIALALAALALLAGPAAAQLNPGDYVTPRPALAGTPVLAITPSGSVATLFTIPFGAWALTMAANNLDFAVLGQTGSTGFLALVTPTGTVSTLASIPSVKGIFENLAVDQDGSYLVPIGVGTIQIARVSAGGTVTTLVPSPPIGGGKPRGIAVDNDSGDYLVGEIPNLYRVAFNGTSTLVATGIAINNSIDMVSDARTGGAIISQQASLLSVDPTTGAKLTLAGGFSGCFPGLAYDRTRDAWVMIGSCAFTNNNVYRVDRSGVVTTVVALGGGSDLEVYGSLNVVSGADPTPGSTFNLLLSEPGSPNAFYLAAASLSARPGIPTPAGTVDLTPDALFTLSLLAPALFVNFQGTLDAQGTASAAVVIPAAPALKGLRFFLSFVTVKGGAIQAVANTRGFTIR